jgi:ATP-dependent Clp protease adapter protein ClpS
MSNSRPTRRPDASEASASPGFFKRYQLILHKTADAALLAVVRAVRDVTRFAEAEAMARMWDAHHRGQAVVLTTYRERAEFLAERFTERGFRVTVEPA